MPPLPTWFAGRAATLAFLQAQVLREPGHFRLLPTTANGQPAFATYMREDDGVHRAHGIMVLTIAASRVTRATMFMDPACSQRSACRQPCPPPGTWPGRRTGVRAGPRARPMTLATSGGTTGGIRLLEPAIRYALAAAAAVTPEFLSRPTPCR